MNLMNYNKIDDYLNRASIVFIMFYVLLAMKSIDFIDFGISNEVVSALAVVILIFTLADLLNIWTLLILIIVFSILSLSIWILLNQTTIDFEISNSLSHKIIPLQIYGLSICLLIGCTLGLKFRTDPVFQRNELDHYNFIKSLCKLSGIDKEIVLEYVLDHWKHGDISQYDAEDWQRLSKGYREAIRKLDTIDQSNISIYIDKIRNIVEHDRNYANYKL